MSTVIFCRGIQGSGKSTWAKQWVQIDPEHRIRISWDDLRNMMGKYWVPSREPLIKYISECLLIDALDKEYDVVIDNMNLSEKSTKSFIQIAAIHMAKIEYRDFKTPLDVCIERDSKREAPIGKDIITNTYNKYKSFYEGD